MPRPLCAAGLAAAAAAGAVLGVLVHPLWLLAVPAGAVGATAVWAGLDLERFLRAVDDDGDAGAGPAGLHP